MSSVLFDSGDFQRLDRERTLIEQRERLPVEPDRSPVEDPLAVREEPENDFDIMLDGILQVLKRGLQND